MSNARLISSLFAARLIRAAAQRGLDPGPLFAQIDVDRDDLDFPSIAESAHLALWATIMRQLDDPGFPIAYAQTVTLDDYGVLGLACKTAADLRQSLTVMATYLPAYADAVEIRLEARGADLAMIVVRSGAPGLGQRCSVESAVAEILGGMRANAGVTVIPTAITFTHAAPSDDRAHRQFFGVAPRWRHRDNSVVFTGATLAHRLLRADVGLARYLTGILDSLVASRRAEATCDLATRVRSEVVRTLPRPVRGQAVARALGKSARTLQRQLLASGVTFESIVDGARRELADALLTDGHHNVAEVAIAAGFADASSFSRAYVRWHGRRPSEARRRR